MLSLFDISWSLGTIEDRGTHRGSQMSYELMMRRSNVGEYATADP